MKKAFGIFLAATLANPTPGWAVGYLENPTPAATESGIGVLSGWHCSASVIEAVIDGVSLGRTFVGSDRGDTAGVCGKRETGFSLLINYNILPSGNHNIKAYGDGVLFEDFDFQSEKSGGVEYLRGKSSTISVSNFPESGKSAVLEWKESKQGYVVTSIASNSKLDGEYILSRSSLQDTIDDLYDTAGTAGFSASGTMEISGDKITQTITVTLDGQTDTQSISLRFIDYGYYALDITNDKKIVIVDRGAKVITSNLFYIQSLGYLNEIDTWVKVK